MPLIIRYKECKTIMDNCFSAKTLIAWSGLAFLIYLHTSVFHCFEDKDLTNLRRCIFLLSCPVLYFGTLSDVSIHSGMVHRKHWQIVADLLYDWGNLEFFFIKSGQILFGWYLLMNDGVTFSYLPNVLLSYFSFKFMSVFGSLLDVIVEQLIVIPYLISAPEWNNLMRPIFLETHLLWIPSCSIIPTGLKEL